MFNPERLSGDPTDQKTVALLEAMVGLFVSWDGFFASHGIRCAEEPVVVAARKYIDRIKLGWGELDQWQGL